MLKRPTKTAMFFMIAANIVLVAEDDLHTEHVDFATTRPQICSEKKSVPEVAPAIVATPTPVVIPKSEPDTDGDGVVDSKDKCPDTPHGYKVDPNGCPTKVTMHINFAFNSSVIPGSASGEIENLVRILKENEPATINIIGHTDSMGSDEYNQKLSESRAHSLASRLSDNGIDSSRIHASGKGEKEPIASNETSQGRAENRRIEIELQ